MRIGDLLLAAGLVDEMQLTAALSHQRQWGGRLGDVLVELGFVAEVMLWKGLAKQLSLPLVSLPTMQIAADCLQAIPHELAQRHGVFPVRLRGRELFLATSEPINVTALDDVAFRTGLKVRPVLAPPREIEWAIRRHYFADPVPCPPPRAKRVLSGDDPLEIIHTDRDRSPSPAVPVTASSDTVPSSPAMGDEHSMARMGPEPHDRRTTADCDAEAIARVSARLQETTELLRLIVDTCVQRGVFSREEYLECVRRLG